jgi:murein DD-endopeptidase
MREISRATRLGLVAALVAIPVTAQDRPPVFESPDLTVPVEPTIVRIDGRLHLVYELHITNLLPVNVSIQRLRAFPAGAPSVTLTDLADTALAQRLGRPGPRSERAQPRIIASGLRAIAYLWIPLADSTAKVSDVAHTLELEVARPSGPVAVTATGGRARVSTVAPVVISPPLRGGTWVAIYDPLLVGGHRTAIYTIDGRARIPGRFAVDFIKLPESGVMDTTNARPPDWNGYGSDVLAVADGRIAAAIDDMDDNPTTPGAVGPTITLANGSGNYVALDVGGSRVVFYEHLARGSVAVKPGDRVKRGQVIGRLGNSGSSSIGPHLHFHVADSGSLLAAEGMPFVFTSFERLGAFSSITALRKGERFLPRDEGQTRRMERPEPNAVVRFP